MPAAPAAIKRALNSRAAKPMAFVLGLAPLAWLAAIGPDGWGFNAPEFINRFLGDWAIRLLLLTLAITPLAQIFRLSGLTRFRRMVGLFAFFYASLHISAYVVFDHFFDWAEIWQDILKRQYITVGMLTLLAMVPLVITSTNRMIRRVGAKRWQKLHYLVYPAAAGASLHHVMMVKANYTEAFIHVAILTVLLAWRVRHKWARTTSKAAPAAG